MPTKPAASKIRRSSAVNKATVPAGRKQLRARARTDKLEPKTRAHAYGVPVPDALYEAIEVERGNLTKAESLLGCMVNSMECETDTEIGPYYPDIAQIALDMVRRSLNGLDSLTLSRLLARKGVKEDGGFLLTDWDYANSAANDSAVAAIGYFHIARARAVAQGGSATAQ